MSTKLSDARRSELLLALQGFYIEQFDVEVSSFQAEQLMDFFIERLGAQLYNQGVQDARRFMMQKLDDLDGEVRAT